MRMILVVDPGDSFESAETEAIRLSELLGITVEFTFKTIFRSVAGTGETAVIEESWATGRGSSSQGGCWLARRI